MEETLYFYSTDGSDAHGPVTREELCQLIRDRVIGLGSFFCHEGETEWRPLDPDVFVRPPGTTRLPPYEPPPYVPPPDARERDLERVEQLQHGWEEPGPSPGLLSVACWLWGIGATVVLQKLRHGADGIVGYVGALTVVAVLPYLFSRPFKPQWRLRVCLFGMVLISAVAILAQLKLNSASAVPPAAPAAATKAASKHASGQ